MKDGDAILQDGPEVDLLAGRRARAAQRKRRRRGPTREKALIAGLLLLIPLAAGAGYVVLNAGDARGIASSPIVDPYAIQSDPSSGLMTAARPAVAAPAPDPIAATAPPEVIERTRVETKRIPDRQIARLLDDALAKNERLAERNAALAQKLASIESDLAARSMELRMVREAADREAKALSGKLRALQATMAAEIAAARAAGIGPNVDPGAMTDEERERLRDLRRLRERQLRSSGVVMDEAPEDGG